MTENAASALPDLTKLRCLFAPGTSARSLFARDETGAFRHISEVDRGTTGLTCPDCRRGLVAKKGKIKVPHFAHAAGEDCQTAGETVLHQMAKQIIAEGGVLHLPEVKTHPKRLTALQPTTTATFDRVEVEPWRGDHRPDLVAYKTTTSGGQSVERALVIEIRVTHKVDAEKLEKLSRRGNSTLEINLSKVKRELDYPGLSQAILTSAPREWLVHRALTEHRRREAERAAEEARLFGPLREALAKARELPPRTMNAEEFDRASGERFRWLAVGAPDPLSIPADDTVFAVEPLLWRTAALAGLAPWHKTEVEAARARGSRRAAFDLPEFEAQGYVKAAFPLRDTIRVPGGRWEPPVLSRLAEFQIAFRTAFLDSVYDDGGLDPHGAMERLLAVRWSRPARVRARLLWIIGHYARHGLLMHATVSSDAPGAPAERRPLRTETDVDALLASDWLKRHPGLETPLASLVKPTQEGRSSGPGDVATALAVLGLEVGAPAETVP